MRGSPELLTCDLSENRSKALPPSLLPRLRISLDCMPNAVDRADSQVSRPWRITNCICCHLPAASSRYAVAARLPWLQQELSDPIVR